MNETLTLISILSVIIPIVFGLYLFKTLNNSMRVLLLLLIISLTLDTLSEILIAYEYSNLWLINLYTPIEFALYGIFFIFVFKESQVKTYFIVAFLITYLIVTYITITEFNVLSDVALGIESIFMISTSALYFYVMLSKIEYDSPLSNPSFWFSSAILIYFAGAFFVFIFSDYRGLNPEWDLWNIHSIVKIVFNLLLTIGFWKARKIIT